MVLRTFVVATVLAATSLAGRPAVALAHDDDRGWHREHDDGNEHDEGDYDVGRPHYHYHERYYDDGPAYYGRPQPRRDYRDGCRTSGTTGLIVGGATGALLGREIDRHGDRATGTILGAGAGALVGREIARKHRC